MARVGVIGGGAFGTAMACVLRKSGHDTLLWAREPEVVASINERGVNDTFLRGIPIEPGVRATGSLGEALAERDFVLVAIAAQHVRHTAVQMYTLLEAGTPVIACSKGIERGSLALMPQVLREALPGARIAVLSGPSFAHDIGAGLTAGVALACADYALAVKLSAEIGNPRFCVHPSNDVPGTALGGVMKNVVAIASGIAAGSRLGESARATLVTMGLAETVRLGLSIGAQRETFDGFSGVGDLMLTANSLQSRNTSLGFALGEGRKLADILASRRAVTEGVHSAASIVALARQRRMKMPIAEAIDRVLNHGAEVQSTIRSLLVDACVLDRVSG